MRATSIILTALALLAILAQSAVCEQVWGERQITSWPAFAGTPQLWGDTVYWRDDRTYEQGYDEIRAWDPSNGERVLAQVPVYTSLQAVFGDTLVLREYVNSTNRDLYLWSSLNGKTAVCTAPGDQRNADLYGQTVVWEDYRSGDSRVYIWDPVNGERRITSAESHQVNPQIWGDTVVWEDRRGSQSGIYTWNPTEGERFIGYGVSPAIHEGKIVAWELARDIPQALIPGHLWEWTPEGGYRELWEMSYLSTSNVVGTQLWGDLVAWGIGFGGGGAMTWHPRYGATPVNSVAFQTMSNPSLYGDKVAWVGNYNVYVSTLVPEPSSLLALGGCMCALMTYASRRRKRV